MEHGTITQRSSADPPQPRSSSHYIVLLSFVVITTREISLAIAIQLLKEFSNRIYQRIK